MVMEILCFMHYARSILGSFSSIFNPSSFSPVKLSVSIEVMNC